SGGNQLGYFYSDYTGFGQTGPITLAAAGNYRVRVTYNYDYEGEYRLRVTLAPSTAQIEAEPNDSTSSATAVNLTPGPIGIFTHRQPAAAARPTTNAAGDF